MKYASVSTLLALTFGAVGCGSSGSAPVAAEILDTPITYAEWQKIEDHEEKFNRYTIQRLPKELQAKAMREARPK